MKFDGATYFSQVFKLLLKYIAQTSKVRQTMQEASRCKYQKSIFGCHQAEPRHTSSFWNNGYCVRQS